MKRGFTLIELLVVISIIALLASIVITSLEGARQKSRNSKTIQAINTYVTAAELYKDENGEYPDDEDGQYRCLGENYVNDECYANNAFDVDPDLDADFLTVMSSLPSAERWIDWPNPHNGIVYGCIYTGGLCSSYVMYFFLEGESQNCGRGSEDPPGGGVNTRCKVDPPK